MKTIFALAALATLSLPALAVDQAAAMDIAKKSNCLACHALDKKLVGPAWNAVGKKYAGDAGAAGKLAAKIKNGGKGDWGSIPMPPNPKLNDADVKTLAAFILTLK